MFILWRIFFLISWKIAWKSRVSGIWAMFGIRNKTVWRTWARVWRTWQNGIQPTGSCFCNHFSMDISWPKDFRNTVPVRFWYGSFRKRSNFVTLSILATHDFYCSKGFLVNESVDILWHQHFNTSSGGFFLWKKYHTGQRTSMHIWKKFSDEKFYGLKQESYPDFLYEY